MSEAAFEKLRKEKNELEKEKEAAEKAASSNVEGLEKKMKLFKDMLDDSAELRVHL